MGTERAGHDADIGFWNPRDVHPIMDKGIQGRLNKWGSWRVGKESRIWAWFPHHLPSVLSHYSFLFFVRETDKPIITNSLFRPELLEHRASWSRFLLLDQAAQLPWPLRGICSSFPPKASFPSLALLARKAPSYPSCLCLNASSRKSP